MNMTPKEAREILDAKTFDTTIDAHVELTDWHKAKEFFPAYKMAKNSLSAWDKVFKDIDNLEEHDYCGYEGAHISPMICKDDVIEIINKHLSEVEV